MSKDSAPQFGSYFGHFWTILSVVVGFILLAMFFFGPYLMYSGYVVWALLRWISSPII